MEQKQLSFRSCRKGNPIGRSVIYLATIRDIADRLGVSISTVSKGLNGGADISEELRQQILDTAVEMNYTTKRMRKTDNRKVCIFIGHTLYETPDTFGFDIILGFRQAASLNHWNVEVVPVTPEFQQQERYDTYMLRNGYSGAFAVCFALPDPWMQQFETTNIPTVLFDNHISQNPSVSYVGADSFEGINAIIEHLASLHHTRIAFVNGPTISMITEQRQRAFYTSMASYHLTVDPGLIVHTPYTGEAAGEHVLPLLQKGATALICGNDQIAYRVLEECTQLGYRVPEDVSIIGFDDLPDSAKTTPPLTTVRQERLDLGKCGFYALHCQLYHLSCSKVLLHPSLIVRGSTGEAKK